VLLHDGFFYLKYFNIFFHLVLYLWYRLGFVFKAFSIFIATFCSRFLILSDLKCFHIYLYWNQGKKIQIPIATNNHHGSRGLVIKTPPIIKNKIANEYLRVFGSFFNFKYIWWEIFITNILLFFNLFWILFILIIESFLSFPIITFGFQWPLFPKFHLCLQII